MPAEEIDYDALAKQHGALLSAPGGSSGGAIDYDALAKQHGAVSSTDAKPTSWLDEVGNTVSHWWDQVNPVSAVKGLNEAASHPIDALKNYGAQNDAIRQKAEDAFKAGNYGEGVRHSVGFLLNGLPGVGATLDTAGDRAGTGDVSGAVGDTLGVATNLLAPKIVPKVAKAVSGVAEGAGEGLYKTALKPRIDTPASEVRAMARTGLDNNLPISEAGAAKLSKLVEEHQAVIDPALAKAGKRGVTVDPTKVQARLVDTERQFGTQVNPESDLKAIERSGDEFLRTQGATRGAPGTPAGAPQPTGVLGPNGQPIMKPGTPATPGVPATRAQPMAPDYAQAIKQGTYRKIKTEYGEMSSAQYESQKALARGIKEELETQIPELKEPLGAQGKLLELQPVLERSVNKAANSGILGPAAGAVGGYVMHGPEGGAVGAGLGMMAKVLTDPALRSRLAITIYKASQANPGKYGVASLAEATARVEGYAATLTKATMPAPADLAGRYTAKNPKSTATAAEIHAAAELAIERHSAASQ